MKNHILIILAVLLAACPVIAGPPVIGGGSTGSLPSQSGASGKLLTSNGSVASWTASITATMDDSAAQFTHSDAATAKAGIDVSGVTASKTAWLKPVCTDNCTLSTPSMSGNGTLCEIGATQTLTGKTLTSPAITLPQVEAHCNGSTDPSAWCTGAGASTLAAGQVSGTVITNYGIDAAETTTLPAAAAGYNFIAVNATKYDGDWLIHTGGSNDIYIDLGDGTLLSGKNHIIFHNAEVGCNVTCYTFRTGASAYSWKCQSASSTTCPHSATGGIDTD